MRFILVLPPNWSPSNCSAGSKTSYRYGLYPRTFACLSVKSPFFIFVVFAVELELFIGSESDQSAGSNREDSTGGVLGAVLPDGVLEPDRQEGSFSVENHDLSGGLSGILPGRVCTPRLGGCSARFAGVFAPCFAESSGFSILAISFINSLF